MSAQLRTYRPADFERLYEIDQACYPPGISYSRSELRWYLKRPGAECILSEGAGEVAGFILTERTARTGHIITIDVVESRRRAGIGTALLQAAEESLQRAGCARITLETATTNEAGVAFWRKHGYRTVGVWKNYYPGPVDAHMMEKRLRSAEEKS